DADLRARPEVQCCRQSSRNQAARRRPVNSVENRLVRRHVARQKQKPTSRRGDAIHYGISGCNHEYLTASKFRMMKLITAIVSIATFLLAFATIPFRATAADDTRQYYQLRVYTTKSEAQQKRIVDYWQNAAVPAFNRLGLQP